MNLWALNIIGGSLNGELTGLCLTIKPEQFGRYIGLIGQEEGFALLDFLDLRSIIVGPFRNSFRMRAFTRTRGPGVTEIIRAP